MPTSVIVAIINGTGAGTEYRAPGMEHRAYRMEHRAPGMYRTAVNVYPAHILFYHSVYPITVTVHWMRGLAGCREKSSCQEERCQ